jgi:anti-sigma factor RsiW
MVIADGYQPELSSKQVEAHLASCSACRQEVGELRALSGLLDRQKRRQRTEEVWKQIAPSLPKVTLAQRNSPAWPPFLFLGVLLLGYRLLELIPDRDFSFLFKLVPLLFAVAVFSYLRENPFKINCELKLEGESIR